MIRDIMFGETAVSRNSVFRGGWVGNHIESEKAGANILDERIRIHIPRDKVDVRILDARVEAHILSGREGINTLNESDLFF